MIVLAKAVDGRIDGLARRYDERHIPDLLAVPGFVSAERYRALPVKPLDGVPQWDFILVYEIAGEDPISILQAMGA